MAHARLNAGWIATSGWPRWALLVAVVIAVGPAGCRPKAPTPKARDVYELAAALRADSKAERDRALAALRGMGETGVADLRAMLDVETDPTYPLYAGAALTYLDSPSAFEALVAAMNGRTAARPWYAASRVRAFIEHNEWPVERCRAVDGFVDGVVHAIGHGGLNRAAPLAVHLGLQEAVPALRKAGRTGDQRNRLRAARALYRLKAEKLDIEPRPLDLPDDKVDEGSLNVVRRWSVSAAQQSLVDLGEGVPAVVVASESGRRTVFTMYEGESERSFDVDWAIGTALVTLPGDETTGPTLLAVGRRGLLDYNAHAFALRLDGTELWRRECPAGRYLAITPDYPEDNSPARSVLLSYASQQEGADGAQILDSDGEQVWNWTGESLDRLSSCPTWSRCAMSPAKYKSWALDVPAQRAFAVEVDYLQPLGASKTTLVAAALQCSDEDEHQLAYYYLPRDTYTPHEQWRRTVNSSLPAICGLPGPDAESPAVLALTELGDLLIFDHTGTLRYRGRAAPGTYHEFEPRAVQSLHVPRTGKTWVLVHTDVDVSLWQYAPEN